MQRTTIITLTSIIIILLVVAVATYLVLQQRESEVIRSSEAGTTLFATSEATVYTDITGQPLSMEQFVGAPLVVMSWASWCPQCQNELIALNDLAAEMQGGEVMFLAINRKEQIPSIERYMRTLPALEALTVVVDTEDHFFASTGGYAMPELIMFDAQGTKVLHQRGAIVATEVRDTLQRLTE